MKLLLENWNKFVNESDWQRNLDADAKCAKKYKRNTPEYEDCLTKEGIPLEEERENALDEKDDSFSKAGEEIEKKGTEGVFTAKAKKRGMTAQEFARKVLANTDEYDLKTVRQASFAKGADTVAKKNKK